MAENKEVYDLIEWCKENDKPFYAKLYLNVLEKRDSITQFPHLTTYQNAQATNLNIPQKGG